jgi:hypothetical protein
LISCRRLRRKAQHSSHSEERKEQETPSNQPKPESKPMNSTEGTEPKFSEIEPQKPIDENVKKAANEVIKSMFDKLFGR